jgi:hypothetical protein
MRNRPEGLIRKEEEGEGGYSWRNNHGKIVNFAATGNLFIHYFLHKEHVGTVTAIWL